MNLEQWSLKVLSLSLIRFVKILIVDYNINKACNSNSNLIVKNETSSQSYPIK